MNAIANGLKENKTFMSKFFAELDAITATMPKTFGLGTKIPVKQISFEDPVTVQVIEDGIVTHCNHDGAVYDAVSYDVLVNGFDGPDYAEITHAGLVCDKCPAWQSEDGGWNE